MTNEVTKAFYAAVGRHFVSLSCRMQRMGETAIGVFLFSGFIVEIEGYWIYITAGHIIKDIRQSLKKGDVYNTWRLGDETAGNKFGGKAVPYDFDIDKWLDVDDDVRGVDCAAVVIEDYYRRQLEAGGVKPLRRETWGNHFEQYSQWALVGLPKEKVKYDGETRINAKIVVAPMQPCDPPKAAGAKVDFPFYCKLATDSESVVQDVDGMSGGPIFGIIKAPGNLKYWLLGVQSRFYDVSRVIGGCPGVS